MHEYFYILSNSYCSYGTNYITSTISHHVFMCVCVFEFVYVYLRLYECLCLCMCARVFVRVYVYVPVCARACLYVRACMYVCVFVSARTLVLCVCICVVSVNVCVCVCVLKSNRSYQHTCVLRFLLYIPASRNHLFDIRIFAIMKYVIVRFSGQIITTVFNQWYLYTFNEMR